MKNPLSEDLNHILCHTESMFPSLKGKKIFLTGGTGFIGKWLLESFIWANNHLRLNAQMHVLSRDPEAFRIRYPHLANAEGIMFYRGDVRTFDFPKERIDYVIHAATDASEKLNQENPLLMLDTIVEGTRRTLEFARQCGAQRFLLTSSGAVYGKQPSDLTHIPEEYMGGPDPIDPRSAYGEGKRLAEMLCSLYARQYGLETKIARCFAFVGPYLPLDVHFAIGNFIRDGLRGGPIQVKGDGTPYRSYLYAADLAIWVWTILLHGEAGRPYNVGAEQAVTIAELADTVASCFPSSVEVQIARKPTRGQAPERYVPSTQRVEIELGLRPLVDVRESIKRTILWHNGILSDTKVAE